MTYSMTVLAQDNYGNQVVDGDGWELSLAEGWQQVGYDEPGCAVFDEIENELGIEEYGVASEFVQWLCKIYPSVVHVLHYEEIHNGFCADCNHYLSKEPVDSYFIRSAYVAFSSQSA